ncbi:unnamed protein product [Adineta steineri]|uniref:Kinesin light chain n=1 Tax=Adineta steineri TaxID=433720 RepID=A0A818LG14_9BILA|nr:unnamed protein product [Adineta steineri]CAF3573788.1 unnamed protein product [Adineta steineri]
MSGSESDHKKVKMSEPESNQNAVASPNSTTSVDIRQPRQRMSHNYLLLWVDTSIDQKSKNYDDTLKQMQTITDGIDVFTRRDACIDFLTDAQEDIKSFLIVKDAMFQQIMPLIDDIPQLDSVYILNDIKILREQWPKKCDKVKSIHTNLDDLCHALQTGIKQFNQDSIAMSFITANEMTLTDNLNQLEPTFMYTKLFKEILLDIKHDEQAIRQFIVYCQNNDSLSLTTINRFEKEYHAESAIRCKDEGMSLAFARSASTKPDTVHILFIMFIDPRIKSTPFASIKEETKFNQEEEILFSMHTIFRVVAIQEMDNKDQLYQVKLQLTSDDDQQLRELTDHIRKEAGGSTGRERLGQLLLQIGRYNKAEELYHALLNETSNDDEKAIYYNQLGAVRWSKGNYEKAISYSEKALEIYQKILPSNHPKFATSYNNIGMVYEDMGQSLKAFSSYEKALEIRQKTLPPNHPDFADSYNNIGIIYGKMGEYSKALSFFEKVLEIQQKTLPSNHFHLAGSYINIGKVYDIMGEYSKAFSFYEKALETHHKTLPPNHLSFADSYNNIGTVYGKMGEYSKALSFFEKALEIRQKTLPSNHPQIADSYNNTVFVYNHMGEYSKALSFFEKAHEIYRNTFPSNHPHIAILYYNIGGVYNNMGEHLTALSFYEKALEIYQNTLPSNHPHLATLYWCIISVCNNVGDYSKAISYFERAPDILKRAIFSASLGIKKAKKSTKIVRKRNYKK